VPEDPNIHPHWASETKVLRQRMDRMDYFEILGCSHAATLPDIKNRYHALQREYHPDTFFESPDTDLKAAVFVIAKRVTEAYVILRNDAKKKKYTTDITGPDRESRLRFTEVTEQELKREQRKEKEEELGKTQQGRDLVVKALEAAKAGDLKGARRDLQTALLFEGDSPSIKAHLEDVKAQIKKGKQS
jgi:curved DNA-binding protein CbpA